MTDEALRDQELQAAVDRAYRELSRRDLVFWLEGLNIQGARGLVDFGETIQPFQREVFTAVSQSLQAVQAGQMPPVRKFWIERTKKAGKDSDLAMCLMWMLAFAKRPLYLQVGAADRDQAAIVKQRMELLLFVNPWLNELVHIHQWKARSANGLAMLDIMAADIAGAHGGTPDVLVINELSHVTKWEFVENLLDNADGVPQGVVIVATNAGFLGTKADMLRRVAQQSEDWQCFYWKEPAPWLSAGDVEDARKRSSASRFARLWHGKWVSGKGDAFSEAVIDRCFTATGPQPEHMQGWRYVAGLDLGVSHDHSALVVLGVDPQGQRVRLAWFRAWEPRAGGEVDLEDVERSCLEVRKRYRVEWLGYDPSQAKLMAQRLRRQGVPCHEVPFVGNRLNDMANTLKETLESGKLELFDDASGRLRRDFGKLNLVEKSYGYRLEAVSDEFGHADVATALVIALPKAVEMLHTVGLSPDDVLHDAGELTEDDLDSMPPELREIYDTGPMVQSSRKRRPQAVAAADDED